MTHSVIPLADLLPKRQSPDLHSGVYFLFKGDELVYIGQSVSVHSRVETHRSLRLIDFDAYAFHACERDQLKRIEAIQIRHYKPKYNIQQPPERLHAMGRRNTKKYRMTVDPNIGR